MQKKGQAGADSLLVESVKTLQKLFKICIHEKNGPAGADTVLVESVKTLQNTIPDLHYCKNGQAGADLGKDSSIVVLMRNMGQAGADSQMVDTTSKLPVKAALITHEKHGSGRCWSLLYPY